MENDNGSVVSSTIIIHVNCSEDLQIVSIEQVLTCGGQDVNFPVTVDLPFAVDSWAFTNVTDLTLDQATQNGLTIDADFTITACSGGAFCFEYSRGDCVQTICRKISRNLDLDISEVDGPSEFCGAGSALANFSIFVENSFGTCVNVDWSVEPSSQATIEDVEQFLNSSSAGVSFAADGEYTISASINACGNIITKTKVVNICNSTPTLPSQPPNNLQWICFDEMEGECYDFANYFCVTGLTATSNDSKLTVDVEGTEICLADIWGRERTSTVYVTPSNACGTGPTVAWTIYVNDPNHCDNVFGDFKIAGKDEKNSNRALNFQTFPNPASDLINFSWNGDYENGEILLLDIYGKTMEKTDLSSTSMDISAFAAGIYFVIVQVEDEMLHKERLVIID